MRVEVPLRALLKGGRKLQGTYSVYLHALLTDVGEEFVYYGITKRGWNTRFSEHVNSSIRNGSQRLFPRKLEELIDARAAEVSGVPDGRPKLAGKIGRAHVCTPVNNEQLVCRLRLEKNKP